MAHYETGLKTRETLINAAGRLAGDLGFASVSTRAIAELAGENVGSIHYHFGSKKKLFEAVVRTVLRLWQENRVDELLRQFDLNSPDGQARAIRAIVHRNIDLLFNHDVPDWFCRVIFQVMRKQDALREIVKQEVIAPSHAAVKRLLRCIDPGMEERQVFLRILIMNTPVFFHADRIDFILAELGEQRYRSDYLRTMEDIIVLQTQLELGLPPR